MYKTALYQTLIKVNVVLADFVALTRIIIHSKFYTKLQFQLSTKKKDCWGSCGLDWFYIWRVNVRENKGRIEL